MGKGVRFKVWHLIPSFDLLTPLVFLTVSKTIIGGQALVALRKLSTRSIHLISFWWYGEILVSGPRHFYRRYYLASDPRSRIQLTVRSCLLYKFGMDEITFGKLYNLPISKKSQRCR